MRRIYVAFGWGLVATIWWLSLTPRPPDLGVEQGDKLGHLLAYGGTMYWFCLLYLRTRVRAAYAAGFVAMGIAIEFVQGWTGYRSFEVADMAADGLGVMLGWGLAHFASFKV